jgi:hypothetical protein
MTSLSMQHLDDCIFLRIFLGEDKKLQHRPLYEAIVLKARGMHLVGATVLRCQHGPIEIAMRARIRATIPRRHRYTTWLLSFTLHNARNDRPELEKSWRPIQGH